MLLTNIENINNKYKGLGMPGTQANPFSSVSLWNTPINASKVTYSDASAIETVEFRSRGLANTWAHIEDLVNESVGAGPSVTWTFDVLNKTPSGGGFYSYGTINLKTPSNLSFIHGSDAWAVFFDPDGVHYYEVWGGAADAATGGYRASYLVMGDLKNGTGFGQNGAGAGVRASGAALLGGVVTKQELDSFSINHALSIELANGQLKAGATRADQMVSPAVSTDWDSVSSYSGHIPMGAHFAIPLSVDLTKAGLTPEGLALAKAYQTYGGYVVDRAGQTTSLAQVDLAERQDTTKASHLFQDIDWIRDHLTLVTDKPAAAATNLAPTALAISSSAVVENAATGTVVGRLSGTDPNPGDVLTFKLLDDAGKRFQILNGDQLAVAAGGNLDFETLASHQVTVRVSDAAGLFYDKVLGVSVTNQNEAPVVRAPISAQSMLEDGSWHFSVPAGTFADVDGDRLILSATQPGGAALPVWLAFDAATATFIGTPPANFSGVVNLVVSATDGALSAATSFALTIAPVNDAPVAAADTGLVMKANMALDIPASLLLANDSDPDIGDALSIVSVSSPQHGIVALKADGATTFVPTSGYVGPASFAYTVSDGHGGSANQTVSITVNLPGSEGLSGSSGNDFMLAFIGDDLIIGSDGNDRINGGAGADIMKGGLGDDTYVVDNVGDKVVENAGGGTDTVEASISYVLPNNVERLVLTGLSNLEGKGNSLANTLVGNDGDNLLNGLGGADTMIGGKGNDTYVVDNIGDVIIELGAQGTDTVRSAVSYTLSANVENLTLTGTSSSSGTGNALDNTLTGNSGDNMIDGGPGADTMVGGKGNDIYVRDNAGDRIVEAAAEGTDLVLSFVNYVLAANVENLTLVGEAAINGTGNSLANVMIGNAAANRIEGGAGDDRMTGGGGNDVFVFKTGCGKDIITDFDAGPGDGDVLELSMGTAFNSLAKILAASAQVGADTVITFDTATCITLQNVQQNLLSTNDFRFV